MKESTPTFVLLSVESPLDDGGNRITRYQVAYDMNSEEFALGECIYCHLHEAYVVADSSRTYAASCPSYVVADSSRTYAASCPSDVVAGSRTYAASCPSDVDADSSRTYAASCPSYVVADSSRTYAASCPSDVESV